MAPSVSSGIFGAFNTLRPHAARSELGNRVSVSGVSSIAPSTTSHGGHGHAKRHSVAFDEEGDSWYS